MPDKRKGLTGQHADLGRAGISDRFTDNQDKSELEAGFMWQKLHRTSEIYGLKAEITSFVTVKEHGSHACGDYQYRQRKAMEMHTGCVIPVYGRSADNIRDHRHVTSLLHRIEPRSTALRLHLCSLLMSVVIRRMILSYFVYGSSGSGEGPESFLS